jgi:predicted membrane channel-forming protein YqfA (hemolysin III family)
MAIVGVHNNIHVPKESWPNWIWLAIEFFIVLAVSTLVSREIMGVFAETGIDETMQNWIFWGMVGAIFLGWYIIIRGLILKKPVLENH